MGGEAESRDGSAGHSQSSEPDLAAGAAVELRPTEEEVPATWMLTPAQPVFRDGNYGGSFCELLVAETIQEYLKFHGLQETHRALADALSKSGLPAAFGASAVELPSEPKGHAVQVELAVLQALRAFDEGQQEAFFQRWRALVPPSPTGSSLELQLYVYFGTYPTRKVLAEKDPSLPLPTADWTELKSFLASRPTWPTEANSSLSSLYALPFVPQAHQNSLLRFIFEESWSEKLRSDVQAFMTAYTSTRHAPSLRHLAGAIIVSKTPPSCPPAHSWHELLRIADLGWASAATALKQQAFENMPSDQPEAKPELLNWLSTGGGKILPDLRKQVFELRGRLGALARHPDEPPVAPSRVQETQRSLRPSIQSLARAPSSAEWEPQGGSSPSGVPVLQDRLWPREVLRGSSASSLGGSHSNAGAVRRLHSARSIESRARTATALLPVPPALDFGRMASQMGGAEEKETDMPPILSVLRAVLRRLALPDEAIRPRRAFLAAFACFGALRALAVRLPEMIGGDPQLREMSLAVMGVCSCEVVGRREIEAAEAQGTGCISALISVASTALRTLTHMHCLAVLQRLSLRGRLQSKMIRMGALDVVLKLLESVRKPEGDAHTWCRLGPGEGPETPDFSIEFTSALLMNLTLRSAGRKRCAELGAYAILVGLIEHPNAQVRTHINGTLYTLLGVKAIRSEAQKRGAEAVFRSALERVSPENDLLQRQLEFLLHQLSRSTSEGDSDNEESDPEPDPPEAESAGDADDGDNFLDEEELAAHFHLASISAVGPGDGYSQADLDANTKAAMAEAAAAEEALRYFRATAGPVADSQQRRFHAFIARSCRNLMSPKRQGIHSSDRRQSLSSPLSPPRSGSSPGGLKAGQELPVTVIPQFDEEVILDASSDKSIDLGSLSPSSGSEQPHAKGSKAAGKGGHSTKAADRAEKVAPTNRPALDRNVSPSQRTRPESRQHVPKSEVGEVPRGGRGNRSVSNPPAGKGRGRGAAGAAREKGVTKSASLPPLPENQASGRAEPNPSTRARSEAPKRSQQAKAAAAAMEVAAAVGQEKGFRRPRNASKNPGHERDGATPLPQLPKRR